MLTPPAETPMPADSFVGIELDHKTTSNDVLTFLNARDDFTHATQISTYDVWIDHRRVRVEVADYGVAAGDRRYAATACWPDQSKKNVGETTSDTTAALATPPSGERSD